MQVFFFLQKFAQLLCTFVMSLFDTAIPMPKPRVYRKRLTEALRNMPAGQSVLLDYETARGLVGFLKRQKRGPVTRKEGDKIRVWRSK
jgi:hypothetical protein